MTASSPGKSSQNVSPGRSGAAGRSQKGLAGRDRQQKPSGASLKRLVEQAPLGIIEWDAQFQVCTWNPAAERIFGYTQEEMLGKHGTVLAPASFRASFLETWDALAHERGGTRTTNTNLTKDGREIVCNWCNIPLRSQAGQFAGVASFVEDVTHHRQSEQQRLNLEKQVRQAQKLESLGTLAGGIAHDFNNIIGAIMGYVELAQLDFPDEKLVRDYLARIHKASIRAKDLVQRILAFSRQQESQQTGISLGPVVEEVAQLLRATLPASIELVVDIAGDVPEVNADGAQVNQACMNLCTNALQAIGSKTGTISLKLARTVASREDAQRHADLQPGEYARITVSDSGPGIPVEWQGRIFDPFFTTKPPGEGSGLGLSVVHGIVQSHGGAAVVESTPGHGATFHLYFPSSKSLAPLDEQVLAPDVPRGKGERVLYVDDESALLTLAEQRGRCLGYTILACSDPELALKSFRDNPKGYDLFLTDVTMPRLRGEELIASVRSLRPEIPIVASTGNPTDARAETLRRAGADEILPKPNTIETFAWALHRALKKHPIP